MFLNIPPAFGLDLSDTSLKLIWLNKLGAEIKIKAYGSIKLPKNLINRGQILDTDRLAEFINHSTQKTVGRLKTRRVVVNLPESRSFIKVFDLKPEELIDPEDSIKKQTEQHFPVAAENLYVRWRELNNSGRVLVAAAPKKTVDDYLILLKKAALMPVALEVEASAIATCLITPSLGNEPVMILDLGANRSSLIIYDQGAIQFSLSIPFSGNSITQEIADTLKLNFGKAELIKKMCGLDPKRCRGVLKKTIVLMITDLINRLKEAEDYYRDNFPAAKPITQILCTGGGAQLIGLTEHLSNSFKVPATIADPLANLHSHHQRHLAKLPEYQKINFTTAIGLAQIGLEI